MRRRFAALSVLSLCVLAGVAAAQEQQRAQRAFEHYEQIRVALAQDTTKNVATHAAALTPLAKELAGGAAAAAADAVAKAQGLEKTREAFGALSDLLVPKLMAAGIAGVQGFICPMNKKTWVQRGTTADNPYYGKAMATCAAPLSKK